MTTYLLTLLMIGYGIRESVAVADGLKATILPSLAAILAEEE